MLKFGNRHSRYAARVKALILTLALMSPASKAAFGETQKAFPTPEAAVVALVDAAKAGDTDELLAIFGPEGQKVLSSGDAVADRQNREVFLVAYEEGAWLEPDGKDKRFLYIGNEDWPFPIPLVKSAGGWRFDTAAGVEEILYRRVGRNEFSAIRACLAYVGAQKEYASRGRDGKPAGIYAQRIVSQPDKHDGLYWKVNEDEELSPLGELVAEAAQEGYARREGQATPFHGYYFRILTAQGKDASGGTKSYLADGEMTGGFALIAYPAEYGNSGVMSFIVNQDGIVFEKDLGPDTATLAAAIQEYEPDRTWSAVE